MRSALLPGSPRALAALHCAAALCALSLAAAGCRLPGETPFAPVDETPPRLVATLPLDGASEVPAEAEIDLFFSEAMDWGALGEDDLRLSSGGVQVPGTLDQRRVGFYRLTFRPAAPLALDATYTFTLSGAARDARFVPLGEDLTITFQTSSAAPGFALSASDPADGAVGVPVDLAQLTLSFSSAPAERLVNLQSVRLDGGARYSLSVAQGSNDLVLSLSAPLSPDTLYTLTLDPGLKSVDGAPLSGPQTLSFRTAP